MLEHLQQIPYSSPQYQKIDVLVMEVLQQITNPIPIIYKFLVIIKTHLSHLNEGDFPSTLFLMIEFW